MKSPTGLDLKQLRRERPRQAFVRYSLVVLAGLTVYAWTCGDWQIAGWGTARRLANLQRFLQELRPFPLQGRDFDWGIAWAWARQLLTEKGSTAALTTVAISVAAIVLAGTFGAWLSLPAARNLATPEPFLPAARPPSWLQRASWQTVVAGTRTLLVLTRAIPEFVWAFLLIAWIGPTAWPAVLALALHNLGILGKLDAEVIENLPPQSLTALRGLGATRCQIVWVGVLPAVLNRFLLFFFYRWETCVREATVLGMLGIVSLGYWVQDARARHQPDTLLFLLGIAATIVLVGDLLSILARWWLRRELET